MPVADCDQKHYDSQMKQNFLFQDYISYLKDQHFSLSQDENKDTDHKEKKCLYLKVLNNNCLNKFSCGFLTEKISN